MIFNPVIKKSRSAIGTAPPKDVNFYDYDGTLLYSYTLPEAQTLTALPNGPSHDGLVFQGWNWELEKIRALTHPMNVGAMYITDDGKTRLKIRVRDKARSSVPLYISQTVSNGVTIDWGDGCSLETLDGTGNVNTSHQYAKAGDYTIALTAADGCALGLGRNSASYCVMGSTEMYCNLLQEANIGNQVTSIDSHAFRCCYALTSISLPNTVETLSNFAFFYCVSLASISIPDSVTSIKSSVLRDCFSLVSISLPDSVTDIDIYMAQDEYSLASVTIPDSVTSIGNSMFSYCRSLASITIPDSVTSISANAFQKCSSMAKYHLKPTMPPALADANAFEGIPSDCIIYVPVGSLEAYKTAANWSAYADYMREEQE